MAFAYNKNKTYVASFAPGGNVDRKVYWRQNLSRARDRGFLVDVKHTHGYGHGHSNNYHDHDYHNYHDYDSHDYHGHRHSRLCSGCGYYHSYDYCPHCHSRSYWDWDTDWTHDHTHDDWTGENTHDCDCHFCNENCECSIVECYDDYVLIKDCHGKIYAVTLDTICCLKMHCNCKCEGDWNHYCPSC